jgi:MSHA biogenesis protein MshK
MDHGMSRHAALALILLAPLCGAGELRDPTRPPAPPAAAGAVVREALPAVTAVFISAASRKAIVDGRLVQAGDSLDDGKVEAVSASGVIWSRRGVRRELQLPRALANLKKPATGPARADNGVQ